MRRAVLITACALTLNACGGGESAPAGPPCQALTQAEFAAQGQTPEGPSLNSVTVRRLSGRSTCAETGGGVTCELSNPGLIHVTSGAAEAYFQVDGARPATITAEGADVRCTLGAAPR